MGKYPLLLSIVSTALISMANMSFAQSVGAPAYCPGTVTDTDGDGWGTENGQPCQVLSSANNYPVCSITTLFVDPDRDGWGWMDDGTCFVDNVSAEETYTVTLPDGTITTGGNAAPVVGRYVKSLGHITSAMQISSEGTLYSFLIPNRSIVATKIDGTTLWEVVVKGDYVGDLILDKSEQTLYAILLEEGQIASYTTGGSLNWTSDKLGRINVVETGTNAVVAGLGDETDFASRQLTSVVSLNLDGSLRWKFDPPGDYIGSFALGRDDRVYIKFTSEPYGNDTTVILAE